jgi:hypothetical protein
LAPSTSGSESETNKVLGVQNGRTKRKRKTVDVPVKLSILDDELGLSHGLW